MFRFQRIKFGAFSIVNIFTCRSADKITRAGTIVGNFNLQSRGKVLYAFQKWGPVIDGDLIVRLPYYSFMLVSDDMLEDYIDYFMRQDIKSIEPTCVHCDERQAIFTS